MSDGEKKLYERAEAKIKYKKKFGKPVPSCGFWPSTEEINHAILTGVELDFKDSPFHKDKDLVA